MPRDRQNCNNNQIHIISELIIMNIWYGACAPKQKPFLYLLRRHYRYEKTKRFDGHHKHIKCYEHINTSQGFANEKIK